MKLPDCIIKHMDEICARVEKTSPKLAQLYRNCYPNTLETAAEFDEDGTVFVLTGDIPAMWLRDSTAEVSHYCPLAAESEELRAILRGVIRRQRQYIEADPYTNAFKKTPDDYHPFDDYPRTQKIVWERKYEIDSLCYPLRLTYLYWKATGDASVLDASFLQSLRTTVGVWETEQHHAERSPYRFSRAHTKAKDTLPNGGIGNPVAYTGMTWSGFRPSDDSCRYGYLVASNMFAAVVLGYAQALLAAAFPAETALSARVKKLRDEILAGIARYAVVDTPDFGKVYACEVDGMGRYFLFDDANVPSLLSAPYLGFCSADDPIYQNTRRFILSKANPYYYEGAFARGVGSPHTPAGYIWHIALSMQGLTAQDPEEIRAILHMLETTDGGTGFMHEGFDANDPDCFTRSWFSWSCALFSELVESAVKKAIL